MTRRILIAVLCGALAAGLAQADGAMTVADLTSAGSAGNLDLLKARRALADAAKNLPWQSELVNTQAKLSGAYDTGGQLSGNADLTVPIIPEVSLGATVTNKNGGNASASLNVSPFAPWRTSYQEKATYRQAKLQLDYQTAKLGYDVESAAYGLLQAQANVTLARAKVALEEQRADISQKSYDMGQLLFADLQTERSNLVSMRQAEFDAERGLLNARVQLYRLVGPATGEPAVREVTVDELTALMAARDGDLAKKSAAQAGSMSLRQAEITLDSLKEQLAATPTYRPNLGLSAQVSFSPAAPAGSQFVGSGSLSFSFSPSEIKTDDRATISDNLADAKRQVELERLAAGLQASIDKQALAVARQALESGKNDLDQALAALVGAQLLYEQGQRTSPDLEQARIDVDSARLRLFQAAAGVLAAQGAILLSYTI
jgi:outer membrane protein TolC